MMLRDEARRIVKGCDGQVHVFAVVLEAEAEGRAALPAIGPLRDGRAVVPVGLPHPRDVGALHALESDRDRARRPLAHAAMAEIGIVIVDARSEANTAAGAASTKRLRHWALAGAELGGIETCSLTIFQLPSFCR